jgi:DNA-binding cell septation regulator SpoVG
VEVTVKWFDGQYPSFNIILASAAGKEPFLEIRGCKIIDGQNGPFISYPSRKQDNGKYWNHVYGSDLFNATVLSKAQASMPRRESRPRDDAPPPRSTQRAAPRHEPPDDDDIPF